MDEISNDQFSWVYRILNDWTLSPKFHDVTGFDGFTENYDPKLKHGQGIDGGQTAPIARFIAVNQKTLGIEAKRKILHMRASRLEDTSASPGTIASLTDFKPNQLLEQAAKAFFTSTRRV